MKFLIFLSYLIIGYAAVCPATPAVEDCGDCDATTPATCLACGNNKALSIDKSSCGTDCGSDFTHTYDSADQTPVSVSACYAACPPKTYSDTVAKTCTNCGTGCQACSSTACTQCTSDTDLINDANCVTACPSSGNQYVESGKCVAACSAENTYKAGNKCVADCSASYILDSVAKTCGVCDGTCAKCSDGNTCTECVTNTDLINGAVCVKTCPATGNQYIEEGKCVPACSAENSYKAGNKCVANCDDSFVLDATAKTCGACDSTCKTCSAAGATNCKSCADPLPYLEAGECKAACTGDNTAGDDKICNSFGGYLFSGIAVLVALVTLIQLLNGY